jgi:hypothetical protein
MAIVVTTYVGAGPQAGTQSQQCSAPANLAAVPAAIANGFLTVTLVPDINGNAPTKMIGVQYIHSIEAFQAGGVADVPPSGP